MRKLVSALTLTLLLTVTAFADDVAASTEVPEDLSALMVVIVIAAIAIPNLLKSRQA